MTVLSQEVIVLGNFADADSNDNNTKLETPETYVQTFGDAANPISDDVQILQFDDADNSAFIETDNTATPDTIDGASGVTALDSVIRADVTLTYADGSTARFLDAIMFQTDNGDLYLANSDLGGADLRHPTGEAIQSMDVSAVRLVQNRMDYQGFQEFTCFAAGTRIATPQGDRLIDTLAVGDLVTTLDHGAQPVRWVGQSTLIGFGANAPVRIDTGALGLGLPKAPLQVSQQHRMLGNARLFERMFDQSEVLIAAKALVGIDGISIEPTVIVKYVHLLLDHHEVIFSNGAPSETFWPGEQAMSRLSPAQRREVLAIVGRSSGTIWSPARHFCEGHQRRRAVHRLVGNAKPMLRPALCVPDASERRIA